MPELPEVERAASLTREIAQGRVIERVETTEDALVYCGITHDEFANAITGREVKGVGRYGKVFYITLDGEGPSPVFHFGMTGMIQVKGEEPTYYMPERLQSQTQAWPPRFMKVILLHSVNLLTSDVMGIQFIFHIAATATSPSAQLAFLDARRLGRIRLCASPMTEPPISNLGFDPILTMPNLEDYANAVCKRSCTIKNLLLDQSFNAGVGNWVADEILYQARVHPEQRTNALTDVQLTNLHRKTIDVCCKAVEVNADSSRFPDDWLFKHRWGKGKNVHTLVLPNGKPATIKWAKVGGRTSAYVTELQILLKKEPAFLHVRNPRTIGQLSQTKAGLISDEKSTPLSDAEAEVAQCSMKRKALKATGPASRMSKRIRNMSAIE
ncbi:hypothetical protein JB92DRAFT_3090830 [Gautieria morchelliformis]|nr:hypothetical protein JB92DRAFT_3090830 [Gautieria morchelliformis]